VGITAKQSCLGLMRTLSIRSCEVTVNIGCMHALKDPQWTLPPLVLGPLWSLSAPSVWPLHVTYECVTFVIHTLFDWS
jgi:hypothetical protein